MPVVPVLPTIAGGILTTSQLAAITQVSQFLAVPPKVILRQTVAQSIPNTGLNPVTFDVTDVDEDYLSSKAGQHSTSVNPSRFTVKWPGRYAGLAVLAWAASATGQRGGKWAINGTQLNASLDSLDATAAGGQVAPAVPTLFPYLNIGDYVELGALQNTAGALLTGVSANSQSSMSIWWVGY